MDHYYKKIKGWFSFRALYEQTVREAPNPAHFVEVGSYKGRSASFMAVEIANSGKKIRFDCVDTWQGSEGNQKLEPENINGTMFAVFSRNTAPVAKYINAIRKPSVEAAALYADNSLDFVFIDADHLYKHVKADIEAWWPKVKPGGVFAGDDYYGKDVRRAVNEKFADSYREVGLSKAYQVEDIAGEGAGRQWRVRK